jgi:hypothetical protein
LKIKLGGVLNRAELGAPYLGSVLLDGSETPAISSHSGRNRAGPFWVDQEWAAELFYRLLLPGGRLRTIVAGNGGWFDRTALESDPLSKALDDALQRERLLAYFVAALEQGNCAKSFAARGTLGSYLRLPTDWKPPQALAPVIQAVSQGVISS